jgi:hypothetical protein
MRTTYPLYEGDGYLHVRTGRAPGKAEQAAGVDMRAIEQKARDLRRQAIADLVTRVGHWLRVKLQSARRREVEAYLAQSTDHADLERRLRDVERRNQLGYC